MSHTLRLKLKFCLVSSSNYDFMNVIPPFLIIIYDFCLKLLFFLKSCHVTSLDLYFHCIEFRQVGIIRKLFNSSIFLNFFSPEDLSRLKFLVGLEVICSLLESWFSILNQKL